MSRATDAAFPFPSFDGPNAVEWGSPGLTIREHFAALAMQGIQAQYTHQDGYDPDNLARHAVVQAEALIAELAKPIKLTTIQKQLVEMLNGFVINEQHMDDTELPVRDRLFAQARDLLAKVRP